MAQALLNPNIVINGETILYKANSFSYKDGFGERNVRSQTAGPGAIVNIVTEDIETQRGMCKFTLISTEENVERLRQWQSNLDNNAITASQGGFSRAFNNAIIISDSDVTGGVDAEFEVSFESDRAV